MIVFLGGIQRSVAFDWDAGFDGIVDNREAESDVQLPQTIIGARGMAQCGTTLDSLHRFRVGIAYLKEFGSPDRWQRADLLLYYRYNGLKSDFYIGSFPRAGVLSYPDFLLSDSLGYYRSTIEGALYERTYGFGTQNVWLDWSSRKSAVRREAFSTGFSGSMAWGGFFVSHYFLYYHYALSQGNLTDEHIQDNGGAALRVGYQVGNAGPFDSIVVRCDGCVSFDRFRHVTGWHTPAGIEAAADLFVKQFGGGIAYYRQLYSDGHGSHRLVFGDGRYASQEYFQGNLYYFPIRSAHVSAELILSFTLIEQVLDTRQLFLLSMVFGKSPVSRTR